MTRAELHNMPGFHPASILAAESHLRSTMRRKPRGEDATSLINNEGRLNGYLDALDDLKALLQPEEKEKPKVAAQMYSGPNTTNQNQR